MTGRDVPRYGLQDAPQPGRTRVVGQEVQMFRPAIRQNEAAKPKVYLNRDQARQELAPARVFEPRRQQTVDTEGRGRSEAASRGKEPSSRRPRRKS